MRILMCPPDYYDVMYEINPWMNVHKKAEHDRAKKQWEAYYRLVTKDLKVKVDLLPAVEGLPDLVFTANGGIVRKQMFIRANFKFKERQGEEAHFEAWFRKQGFQVKTLDRPLCFEGEGDALTMDGSLFSGYPFRSMIEAQEKVAQLLKLASHPIELCDNRFYHLDTCFAPLDDRTALAFMPAFEVHSQMIFKETIPDLIEVPEEEAVHFACNVLVAGKDVVIPQDCPHTYEALKKRGFTPHPLDFSEYIKSGGAAKCLTLKL